MQGRGGGAGGGGTESVMGHSGDRSCINGMPNIGKGAVKEWRNGEKDPE